MSVNFYSELYKYADKNASDQARTYAEYAPMIDVTMSNGELQIEFLMNVINSEFDLRKHNVW